MKSKLLDELIRTKTVIPAISDTIFKRLMMEHLDYLGYILENIMPLTQEEVMKGEFLINELPSNHLHSKSNRLDLVLKVRNYIINILIFIYQNFLLLTFSLEILSSYLIISGISNSL